MNNHGRNILNNEVVTQISSEYYRAGLNLKRRIKKNSFFAEIAWTYRVSKIGTRLRNERGVQALFRFTNKKINESFRISYDGGDFRNDLIITNVFSVKIGTYLTFSSQNRYHQNNGITNGFGISINYKFGQITATYLLNSYEQRPSLDQTLNVQLRVNF